MHSRSTPLNQPAIELRGIDKRFGSVHANKNISLSIQSATIHGIIGENGAGKSTLMSIIYGFYEADKGDILINNTKVVIRDSNDAIAYGIGMVHQHFMLVDNMTALENIILGAESSRLLKHSLQKARNEIEHFMEKYNLKVPLNTPVASLPIGLQQRIEILKAIYRGAKILILDEPTGVLTPQETEQFFNMLRTLKEQGATIVLITHKLQEVMDLTDNISVMRQGEIVSNIATQNTNREHLAELMVGRKVSLKTHKQSELSGDVILAARNIDWFDNYGIKKLDNINLDLRAGEIIGIAGVSGNGQTELLNILSGITPIQHGEIQLDSITVNAQTPVKPDQMRALRVGHIPEDRHKMGLINSFSAEEAFILGFHKSKAYNKNILLNQKAIRSDCLSKMKKWDVRPNNPLLKTANFSGGNQQKLILAREVEKDPEVLLIGQPTRGVDIGAIESIYKYIIQMRDAGKAILLISVELEEIINLSDRIAVMYEGRFVHPDPLPTNLMNEKKLGLMMAGIIPDDLHDPIPKERI